MIVETTIDTTKAHTYEDITVMSRTDVPIASIMLHSDGQYVHLRVSRRSAQAIADAMIRAVAMLDFPPKDQPLAILGQGDYERRIMP